MKCYQTKVSQKIPIVLTIKIGLPHIIFHVWAQNIVIKDTITILMILFLLIPGKYPDKKIVEYLSSVLCHLNF